MTDEVTQVTVEEQAAGQGHVPLEQWKESGKDPADWKDARTFLREGEMMSRIKKQSDAIERYKGELAEVKTVVKELNEHQKKIAQLERTKALKELKARKVEALQESDHAAVVEIDEQIEELKEPQAVPQSTAPQIPAEVASWLNDPKNEWYHSDPDLNFDMDKLFNFRLKKGRTDFAAMLQEAQDEVAKRYPNKFKPAQSTRTTIVDKETEGRPSGTKRHTYRDLDEAQIAVAKRFVKMGTYKNIQEYVDKLDQLGELTPKR
jgi:DNA repair exonuclease SbcCD ATPase subunit